MKKSLLGLIKNGRNPKDFAPGVEVFKKLDIAVTANKLKLVEKGRVSGQAEKPPSDNESNDAIENKIISIIDDEKNRSYDDAVLWFSTYRDRLKSLGVESLVQQLEVGKKKITIDIRALLSTLKDDIFQLAKNVQRRSDDLLHFKEINMIHREPNFTESKILGLSIVFLIFIIESVLNGYFFAKGHELGYLGGISISVLISAVNVVFTSYILGWLGLRQILHINWLRKLIGFLSLLLLIVFVPVFNFSVAHYRQAFIQQAENPSRTAIDNIISNPLMLSDFDSYMLIIMGIIVCLIACIDFWNIFDPYPGYEKLYSKLNELQNEYSSKRSDFVEELQLSRDSGFSDIKNTLEELESRQEEYRALIDRMRHLSSQVQPHFERLEQDARQLLSIYRDANAQIRTTPSPDRFKKDFSMNYPDASIFLIPSAVDVSTILAKARNEVPRMIEEINLECEKALEDLPTLESLFIRKA